MGSDRPKHPPLRVVVDNAVDSAHNPSTHVSVPRVVRLQRDPSVEVVLMPGGLVELVDGSGGTDADSVWLEAPAAIEAVRIVLDHLRTERQIRDFDIVE